MSDAVAAQGLADGRYRIGPQAVAVAGGRAFVAGTSTLCGSTAALDDCVITFKQSIGTITFTNNVCYFSLCALRPARRRQQLFGCRTTRSHAINAPTLKATHTYTIYSLDAPNKVCR